MMAPKFEILVLLAVSASGFGCSRPLEAKTVHSIPPEAQELDERLTRLGEKVQSIGLYYDHDVRSSIEAMPRSLLEKMLPSEGYVDENVNRASSLECNIESLYGEVTECARSFVNFLRSYSASAGSKPQEFSSRPEWTVNEGSITVVFDAHLYELEFRRSDLKLVEVRYRGVEGGG